MINTALGLIIIVALSIFLTKSASFGLVIGVLIWLFLGLVAYFLHYRPEEREDDL